MNYPGYEQTESIPGDLLEEFTDLASKSGVASARRWYWRQSMQTISHLVATGFRVALWSVVCAVAVGVLLQWKGSGFPEKAVIAVLDFHRQPHVTPYYTWPQIQARLFWLTYGVLGAQCLMALFTGFVVAAVAKGQEILATVLLSLIIWLPGTIAFFALTHGHFILWLITTALYSIMFAMGGVIVRKLRLAIKRRTTPV
jgi:hypothetical protein